MPILQGILWDNDGLLVDTEKVYFAANQQALKEKGIALSRTHFREHSLRQGRSLMDLAREAGRSEAEVQALRRKRDRIYLALLRRGVRVMPGVRRTLAALHKRGIRMGIVTSSQRVHFDAIHKASGLLPYFDFALTLEDYPHSKPHPAPYRAGQRRLGLPREHVMAVEDSERGLRSATAAGLRCVVVPSRDTVGGDFQGAAAVLSRVSDLLSYF